MKESGFYGDGGGLRGFQTRERDGLFLSTKRAGTEIVLNNKALEKVV